MDVYNFCVLVALALVSLQRCSAQALTELSATKRIVQQAADAIATNDIDDTAPVTVNCTTAKGVSGVCVDRQYCEYSTYAIDLTLYAPKNYVRFLKDWPEWDDFDNGINYLRKKKASKSIKKTLEAKYIELKEYIKIQLDASKPLAKEAVRSMIAENAKRMEKVDTSDLTLEVFCTRKQLNELVLNQPITTDVENSIFNLTEFNPTSIAVNVLPIEAILNWFSVHISIDMKNFTYQRWTSHRLKHVLINTRNGIKPENSNCELKNQLQMKQTHMSANEIDRDKIYKTFTKVLDTMRREKKNENILIFQAVIDILKSDLHGVAKIKVPGIYKQYSSKYPYVRKLRKEVDNNAPSASYNLAIEETLTPSHCFQFGKNSGSKPSVNKAWFVFECTECRAKFNGDEMYTLLREHFDLYHSGEPDWECTNCHQSFVMTELARNKWLHYCQ